VKILENVQEFDKELYKAISNEKNNHKLYFIDTDTKETGMRFLALAL
jgi:hypothetical protein